MDAISRRDYFAGQALQGLLAARACALSDGSRKPEQEVELVDDAYRIADFMERAAEVAWKPPSGKDLSDFYRQESKVVQAAKN